MPFSLLEVTGSIISDVRSVTIRRRFSVQTRVIFGRVFRVVSDGRQPRSAARHVSAQSEKTNSPRSDLSRVRSRIPPIREQIPDLGQPLHDGLVRSTQAIIICRRYGRVQVPGRNRSGPSYRDTTRAYIVGALRSLETTRRVKEAGSDCSTLDRRQLEYRVFHFQRNPNEIHAPLSLE